ncbi:Uncharacterized protein BP5553_05852 [Venustampulla echinocandica]|uniref:Uncharacterized protein n=1 Tax=Venustampulla echinocandica TaxID=2656787 RepID=A0A370TLV1_9HELO|nr:Uncharacterized protein BP5553_05852 [Venustampulla echinocandica]RDL36500.1 Uncharacterized protein BP5553_05852 [Venustampulla echinocandica]
MYFSISPSAPSTSYSTAPMDIPSSNSRSSQSPSCAYPSWPRRSSLSSDNSSDSGDYHNRSFIISDEELFPGVFDDSELCSPADTPNSTASRSPASLEPAQMIVDHGTLMREVIAQEKAERRRRRARTSGKKSRSGSAASSKKMSPIQEAVE